jgi:hypothetical protein
VQRGETAETGAGPEHCHDEERRGRCGSMSARCLSLANRPSVVDAPLLLPRDCEPTITDSSIVCAQKPNPLGSASDYSTQIPGRLLSGLRGVQRRITCDFKNYGINSLFGSSSPCSIIIFSRSNLLPVLFIHSEISSQDEGNIASDDTA